MFKLTLWRHSNKLLKILIGLSFAFLFWLFCFSYNTWHHVSIERNWLTGKTILNEAGFKITPPWTQVIRIDTRPAKVCVECSCRGITCELVQFDKNGWEEFLAIEGFRYYWLSNRVSINFGHENEYRGMKNILRGYAFDKKEYKFIKRDGNI